MTNSPDPLVIAEGFKNGTITKVFVLAESRFDVRREVGRGWSGGRRSRALSKAACRDPKVIEGHRLSLNRHVAILARGS